MIVRYVQKKHTIHFPALAQNVFHVYQLLYQVQQNVLAVVQGNTKCQMMTVEIVRQVHLQMIAI